MIEGMNKYGLPAKYGIIGFFGGIVGAFLTQQLGSGEGYSAYTMFPIGAAIGGVVGGWIRQRRGKKN